MFIIWPVTLIIIFYKANDIGSEKLLRFICLLTIILWVAFIIYFFFSLRVEDFFYDTLKTMVPKAG
jgi:cytosine/uracil/thiamine/allantoin permease